MPIEPFVYTGTHIVIHLQQFISFALPKTAFYEILLLFTWIIVVIRICQKYSAKSRKIRDFNSFYGTFLEKQMEPFTVNASKLVDAAMKELGLKKKPRIQMEPIVKSPHIGGIFRCTLHLPCQWDVPEQVYYIAIKHELAHLKNKDLLFQRISLIVRIIHWFNPAVYLLIKKMNQYQELAADAMACEGESRENRRAFQLALVDLSAEESNVPDMLAIGLGTKRKGKFKNFTEERILTIDNKKLYNHKFIKLAATAVISVVMFTLALIPALAYNLPATVECEDSSINSVNVIDVDLMTEKSKAVSLANDNFYTLMENIDFTESNFVCIDENGIITYDYDMVEPRIIPCNHNYLAARVSYHTKHSD
ncbi:MAG: M56 family metallopeptidase, partial [Lachnospiraceae bacterium]|nr:M56 family metallopeptidase [Lachnospiraceae bacterium]